MKCPYFNNEMDEGEVRSKGRMYFLPTGETEPILYTEKEMEKRKAVYIHTNKESIWAEYPNAHICRQCSKIVIDY